MTSAEEPWPYPEYYIQVSDSLLWKGHIRREIPYYGDTMLEVWLSANAWVQNDKWVVSPFYAYCGPGWFLVSEVKVTQDIPDFLEEWMFEI